MRVLIVEDKPAVADLLGRALREAAWAPDVVGTGAEALAALAISDYDLAVLDVGLPDMDGFELCRQWRRRGGKTPILMLTARQGLSDRVTGLDAGADDYLGKPFDVEELLARLRALARRPPSPLTVTLRLADLEVDTATRAAHRGDAKITLTAREYALLEYLLRNPGRIVTRGQILEHVWDDNFDPVANVVDVLIGRLRRKVDLPGLRPLIHTVRGAGYQLCDRDETDGDSRLRLQLAAWFALVFVVGLGAADVALFTWLRRDADRNLTRELSATAAGVAQALRRELDDTRGDLREAASEAVKEWPADSNSFVIYDGTGARVAARGSERLMRLIPAWAQLPAAGRTWDVPLDAEGDLRLALVRQSGPAFSVVALLPTASVREANEQLALWLSLSVPIVMLLALSGGYVLARRALGPLRTMTAEITAIDPRDLGHRLRVRHPPDELDGLAEQFNRLLERLATAQARSRRFLAQAAHQIRTPLTVVRGESGLGLERPRTVEEHRDVLRRIALAAEQMTHRVDDLFLLAQAESGDRPALADKVDVDGLVLECVDLMRGRAAALGRRLELGTMDAAEVRGNEPLIREGVLELLENACRHGDAASPIRVSTLNGGGSARIEVASGGVQVPVTALEASETAGADRTGLGLSIVRWIASVHGGELTCRYDKGSNVFTIELAATPANEGGRP